ncbi:MAG: hypothetical protein AAF639_01225 [Chloroflexota bacterium]
MKKKNIYVYPLFMGISLTVMTILLFKMAQSTLQAAPIDVQQATTIRVSNSGANTGDCGSETAPCQTIQFAVNKANSGDWILVAGGVYGYNAGDDIACNQNLGTTGVVCVVNKELNIRGGYTANDWVTQDLNANVTIIDGTNTQRGVLIVSTGPTTNVTVDGFTIQNGLAQGIAARPFPDNIASFGGGMFVDSAQSVTLNNIIFKNNRSIGEDTNNAFGGAGAGGGLALRQVPTTLTNVTFDSNQAVGGAGAERGGYATGGGIHTAFATVTGSRLTFINNIARAGNSTGLGSTADGQRADALGAGASFQDGSDINVQYLTSYDNQATGGNAVTNSGGAFGAGLFVEKAIAEFRHVDLRRNVSKGGAAINGYVSRGGGAEFIDSTVTMSNAKIIDNQAIGGDGSTGDRGPANAGGLSVTWTHREGVRFQLTNAIIAGNFTDMGQGSNPIGGGGSGVMIQAMEAELSHVTIADNRVGAGMFAPGLIVMDFPRGGTATVSDSIIANHSASIAAVHVQPSSQLTFNRGLWSNNSSNMDGAGTYSGVNTMLSGDAAFVNASNFDYHLSASSAAIDQATGSTTPQDIDGRGRDGVADIGAYEAIFLDHSLYLPIVTR